jgi:hypothetical protein
MTSGRPASAPIGTRTDGVVKQGRSSDVVCTNGAVAGGGHPTEIAAVAEGSGIADVLAAHPAHANNTAPRTKDRQNIPI